MKWILLWLALAFATHIWLCIRVGRSSAALAVATFFFGPIAALYTLIKHRGDDETSITVPFVANLVIGLGFVVVAWQVVWPMMQAAEAERYGPMVGAAAPVVAPAASPVAPSAVAPASASASAAQVDPPAASSPSAPAGADVIEAYAQALRDLGLQPQVQRQSDATKLPAGVTDAAVYTVNIARGAGSAASAGASGAAASSEYAVTLYRCASLAACRALAGLQMQESGADKRRLLQSGLVILSTPAAQPGDADDMTPAAMASAFRRLQP